MEFKQWLHSPVTSRVQYLVKQMREYLAELDQHGVSDPQLAQKMVTRAFADELDQLDKASWIQVLKQINNYIRAWEKDIEQDLTMSDDD